MVLGADDEATQNTKANIAETEKEIKLQEALLREEYVIVGTVVDDDCAARQQGMDGSYIILELDTWTVGDEINYFSILQALQGKPKTLVVLKDDVVSRHHFENFIGISNKRKHVGKEEKQRIVDLYQQWKENNAQ